MKDSEENAAGSMLVSVHLPKTAGTSFAKALEEHYGSSLLKDYGDYPINTPVYDRNRRALQAGIDNATGGLSGVSCAHGHFLPVKYLLLADRMEVKFVTWMRHPVERVVSHYWFWKEIYTPGRSESLASRVVEENWSLERFCLCPELKDLYCQFLWGFPLEYFDFIGITEHFEEDFARFARTFWGAEAPIHRENLGQKKGKDGLYQIDNRLREAIEKHHARDMELYSRALAARKYRDPE